MKMSQAKNRKFVTMIAAFFMVLFGMLANG